MDIEMINNRDLITMKLLYYFITIKNYSPVIVQGAKNEIWLENLEEDIKIVRIVNDYIHNDEQMQFDIFKTRRLVNKIKKKTFSFKMQVLNIFTDLGENVDLKKMPVDDKFYKFINAKEEADILNNNVIKENFKDLKNNFKFNEEGFGLFLKITNDINQKNREEAIKNSDVFEPKKPIVTISLIGVLVAIYFIGYILLGRNYLINVFSVYGIAIKEFHQYYRLLTGTFLHADIFHLLSNCYCLYIVGNQIESFYGRGKFLIIYFFSALTGSLLSITLNSASGIPSIGASGAIFGLMGSLLYFGYYYRVYLGSTWKTNILPVIVLNLLLGFIPGIDYFAHIGGLIGGILISMALGLKYKYRKIDRVNGIILSIMLVVFLTYLGIFFK